MRRFVILVIALLAIGCSAHSSMPVPLVVAPVGTQVSQWQPLFNGVWTILKLDQFLPPYFSPVSDGKSKIWFLEIGDRELYSVTMNLTFARYPVFTNGVTSALALGADGNLWVAGDTYSIARVTPNGIVTEFSNGGLGDIESMVAGPDGALWFTNCTGGTGNGCGVGRLATDGTYSLFPLPNTNPVSITVGPDKNLWIADSEGAIHRFTTSGVDTAFPVTCKPTDIIAGPDGSLYFSSTLSEGAFGSVTTSGLIKYIPDPGLIFTDLTNGPKGLIWGAAMGSGWSGYSITSFDPATSTFGPVIFTPKDVYKYPVFGVTAGPDRNIWVTSNRGILTYVRLIMTATPDRLTFEKPGDAGTFTVTEAKFHGKWRVSTTNTMIAIAIQSSPGRFIVKTRGVGRCIVTVRDGIGNSIPVHIRVD